MPGSGGEGREKGGKATVKGCEGRGVEREVSRKLASLTKGNR